MPNKINIRQDSGFGYVISALNRKGKKKLNKLRCTMYVAKASVSHPISRLQKVSRKDHLPLDR